MFKHVYRIPNNLNSNVTGIVFLNQLPNPPPLRDCLGALPEKLKRYDLERHFGRPPVRVSVRNCASFISSLSKISHEWTA
jgi:hypothetical protein